MRSAILTLLLLCFCSSLAHANEAQLLMPATPWMNEGQSTNTYNRNEIEPRKISLQDLERILPTSTERDLEILPSSALETLYSERIIDELSQYGYDLFSDDTSELANASIPAGAVQGDYILSAGDRLNIILRGQINSRDHYEIDNQGLLVVAEFSPIIAAGRRLRDIQADLQAEVKTLHNTQIYTSLASVRQIGVLVVGHVDKPGRKNLTAFHNIMDALSMAGGIQKTGSLRRIKLVRQGKSYFIDLYQLLMASGGGADKLLQDGDRLIVPPIGPTMAISGSVKRPAIYEIRKGENISLHQALGLGGGVLTPGQNRYMKLEYTYDGDETVQDITDAKARIFGDGSILMIAQSEQKRANAVTLSGHTRQPGTHDHRKAKSLSALITDDKVLGNNIYPLIGVIERRDAQQLSKKLIAFSPLQVLKKKHDQALNENDIVRLFSMDQIRALDNAKEEETSPLLHQASMSGSKIINEEINDPVLRAFLNERAAFIRGAVRQAGAYPVTEGTTLENIIAAAGGIALEANRENIELSRRHAKRHVINLSEQSPEDFFVQAGDTIRVNQKFHKVSDNSITLLGEVNHPGRYDLMAGDTLFTLIARAGGLTKQSYPNGAIFSRASERHREENRYRAQAQELEMQLAASLRQSDGDKKPNLEQVGATQSLITQLKHAKAVGRITVEADPSALKADPKQDILLEAGDKIFIPKRPLTVRVAGEVLSPAALQFREAKDPSEYIRQAGGTTHYADKDRTFVIFPDGSAEPLNVSLWNHRATFIPPGSTIIVPRDPEPFDFLQSAGKVAQLFANLAISGLYIDAIGDDD